MSCGCTTSSGAHAARQALRLGLLSKQVTNSVADMEDLAGGSISGKVNGIIGVNDMKQNHACACDATSTSHCSPADLVGKLDEGTKDTILANTGKLEKILAKLRTPSAPSPPPLSAAPVSAEQVLLDAVTPSPKNNTGRIETPEDYLASLSNRGLVVYMFGELVADPLDHPVIRPSVNAVAETYKLGLQQPEIGTAVSPISGVRCNRFLHVTTRCDSWKSTLTDVAYTAHMVSG
eukprot:SAG31_NODE_4223_length_3448_cov_4.315318_2_plen_234_part_00